MGGEQSYNQAVNDVVQAMIRQLLLLDEGNDEFLFDFAKAKTSDDGEIVSILYQLQTRGLIKIERHETLGVYVRDGYIIKASKKKLDEYATSLKAGTLDNETKNIPITIELNDLTLSVVVDDEVHKIRQLHQDTRVSRLFKYIFRKGLDRSITLAEMRGDEADKGIESIERVINSLKDPLLKPFIEEVSRTTITLNGTVLLTESEYVSYKDKLRDKNFG
jgi:hypothetical protein